MEPYFRFIQPPRYFSHFNLSSLYSYKFFSFTKNRFKWPTRLLCLRPHCKIPYITSCKGIQSNLGFCIWRRGFRIPCTRCKFLSVEREFQMPIVIRRITDSNSNRKKFPDFPFRKQKSPGFWNPDFLILDDVFLHRFTWEEEKCGI